MSLRLDDPRLRVAIAVGVVLSVLLSGLTFVSARRSAFAGASESSEAFLDLVAAVASGHPEAAKEIASALKDAGTGANNAAAADSLSITSFQSGRRLLAEYGITAETVPLFVPSLQVAALAPIRAAFLVLAAGALVSCVWIVAAGRMLAGVDEIAGMAARIAAGSYRLHASSHEAGSLGRLSFQIAQAAHRLREQVEAAEAEEERLRLFLADMSHQLKTPLSSVRMYQELLLGELDEGQKEEGENDEAADDSLTGDEYERQFVRRSLSQLDRMEWLVRTLLTQARIEAGSLPISLQPASLVETVTQAVDGFRRRAAAGDITLSLDIPAGDDVMVPHDPRWLGEAVSNVVKNALDHTPAGGAVSLSILPADVFVRVVIQDSGAGIATEDLPFIFNRFFRGRPAADGARPASSGETPAGHNLGADGSTVEGTGLGLALAKAIVERHGGTISVAPKGHRTGAFGPTANVGDRPRPTGGTTFIITLTKL